MDSGQIFFIRRNNKVHGPFAREHLGELAAGGHISGVTEIAPGREGPWARLETLPALRGVLGTDEPPAFERANTASKPPIDLRDVIAAANRASRPPPGAEPAAPDRPASAPHDVRSLLRFNLAIEQRRGLHQVKPPPERRSRRRRDYFVLMAIIGCVIFGILFVECYAAVQMQVLAARMPDQFGPVFNAVVFHSPIFAWGLTCFAALGIGLGWIIFGVMDNY